ncbi:MAG: GspH/FimT family protein [Gammaproteobacteria bacterium]|jgi:type IV fimbrial biogenesis protein FimT
MLRTTENQPGDLDTLSCRLDAVSFQQSNYIDLFHANQYSATAHACNEQVEALQALNVVTITQMTGSFTVISNVSCTVMNGTHPAGLTALELLVALALGAVVAGIGLPALHDAALNARRLAAVNGFVALIQFARGAAQARSATIYLCQADAGLSCNAAAGGGRWIVAVAPVSAASDVATNARVLRILELDFTGTVVSNRTAFTFRPFPQRSTNGTLSFCDPRGGRNERAVVVSVSGRPRLVHPSSDQGLAACRAG